MATNPSQILMRAREILDEGVWEQGYDGTAPDGLCLIQALNSAIRYRYDNAYLDALQMLKDVTGVSAVVFNDQPGRTKEEVLNALQEAAGG